MSKSLPDQANIDHLKNEAKALLRAHRQGDPTVCAILRQLPQHAGATDEDILAAKLPLQKVQHALAKEYGFESWHALSHQVADRAVFNARVRDALSVFTAKGPPRDSTGSGFEQRRSAEIKRLLKAGDSGFLVMQRLARSTNGRARNAAAVFFAVSDDKRAVDELRALLTDQAVMVRSRAVRFYAAKIHPSPPSNSRHKYQEPANKVPDGVNAILPLVQDASVKVQLEAIACLAAYAELPDQRIVKALKQALNDPHHKVQHSAARVLGVSCPKCGP
jgi:hypothetical protein